MRNPFKRRVTPQAQPEGQKIHTADSTGARIVHFNSPIQGLLRLYGTSGSYALLYAGQPNVRTAVQTVAREAAELTLKMYYKDDRGKDKPKARIEVDHPMIELLQRPTPGQSSYRFWQSTFAD